MKTGTGSDVGKSLVATGLCGIFITDVFFNSLEEHRSQVVVLGKVILKVQPGLEKIHRINSRKYD